MSGAIPPITHVTKACTGTTLFTLLHVVVWST